MITLPFTCKNLLINGFIVIIAIGVILAYFGYEEQGLVATSWMLVAGVLILAIFGVVGLIVGIVELMDWLLCNVRCRCEANE